MRHHSFRFKIIVWCILLLIPAFLFGDDPRLILCHCLIFGIALLCTILLCFLLFLGGILQWLEERKTYTLKRTRNLFLYIVSYCCAFAVIISIQNKLTYRAAVPLIDALNRHYEDTMRFPYSLDDLIPNYISDVPRTKIALGTNPFHYSFVSDNKYELWFFNQVSFVKAMRYDRHENRWQYN